MIALGALLGAPQPRPHAALQLQTEGGNEATDDYSIVQAALDKRLFRGLELANGMRVVLVSDPKAEMAGASVDVHVGSFSDPEDLPGLAHFCEHMVFLSSTKCAARSPRAGP